MRRPDPLKLLPGPARAVWRQPRTQRLVLLIRRSVKEFSDDHCAQLAAAVSYHLLFSIFPLAITGVGIVGLVAHDAQSRSDVVDTVTSLIPLSEQGQQQLHNLLTSVSGRSGALGLLGLLGVLWAASGVMTAIRTAINVAWDVEERRPFVRGKAVDLLLLLGTFVLVSAALGVALLTSVVRRGGNAVPDELHWLTGSLATTFAILTTAALLFATFVALYRLLPTVTTTIRDIWPGAATAAVGVSALQYGFSIYLQYFSHYNRVYGSLGVVVAFMFLAYLATAIFLFGAEIASEIPRLPPREESAQGQAEPVESAAPADSVDGEPGV